MMLNVGAVQMAMSGRRDDDIAKAMGLVRQAAGEGAKVILPPELFEGHYFLIKKLIK